MSTFFWTIPTQNIKNLNKHAIVDLIRFTSGGISRVELARQMNLTRAAVTAIVNDLLDNGVVREVEDHYPSGRRPIVLEINPDRGFVLGIDMGATHVTILLADHSARLIGEIESPLEISAGPRVCLKTVVDLAQALLEQHNVPLAKIHAVGVGVPGPVVAGAGIVSFPPIMPGWNGFPISDTLVNEFNCPVILSNDAELGAVGEWAYGAARGVHNLLYLKVGTGIGAGILLDGQIYRGISGSAGEIGHITINENGPLCTCGNYGCLEAMAGGKAIAAKAVELVQKGLRTQLASIQPVGKIRSQDVINAARGGDLLSQQIIMEVGVHLGTALASAVNLFNPAMIVVGGGVAQIGDLLLEPVRRTVYQRGLRTASQAVRITTALLERRSSGMGAVVQALSIVLHQLSE